jgi:hypothetical protein
MANFWEEEGTSGWAGQAAEAAKPATVTPAVKPTKEEMVKAWSENNGDPAKVYELMQKHGLSVTDVSNALGADKKAFFNYLRPIFVPTQERSGAGDNMDIKDVYKYGNGQAEYTDSNSMSRDDFLKKYGTTFVADDKGGNAASEVAGQDVGAYYDRWLDPKRTLVTGGRGGGDEFNQADPSAPQQNVSGWGTGYKYRDANPYFDAWDNVNPHPESQDLGGLGEFWRQIGRPIATGAAMYAGVGALNGVLGSAGAAAGTGGSAGIGSGTVLGGGTATSATTAKGVAGILGMSPGYGATALNAGALNTGMSLAQGNNIGDALKSGVTAAALSPISGFVGDATTSALGDTFNPNITKGIATFAGNAAQGGAQGAIDGTGILSGIRKGALNGIVSASGNYMAQGITGKIDGFDKLSPAQQRMVNTTISKLLQGKNPTKALIDQVANAAIAKVAKTSNTKTGGWSA